MKRLVVGLLSIMLMVCLTGCPPIEDDPPVIQYATLIVLNHTTVPIKHVYVNPSPHSGLGVNRISNPIAVDTGTRISKIPVGTYDLAAFGSSDIYHWEMKGVYLSGTYTWDIRNHGTLKAEDDSILSQISDESNIFDLIEDGSMK